MAVYDERAHGVPRCHGRTSATGASHTSFFMSLYQTVMKVMSCSFEVPARLVDGDLEQMGFQLRLCWLSLCFIFHLLRFSRNCCFLFPFVVWTKSDMKTGHPDTCHLLSNSENGTNRMITLRLLAHYYFGSFFAILPCFPFNNKMLSDFSFVTLIPKPNERYFGHNKTFFFLLDYFSVQGRLFNS